MVVGVCADAAVLGTRVQLVLAGGIRTLALAEAAVAGAVGSGPLHEVGLRAERLSIVGAVVHGVHAAGRFYRWCRSSGICCSRGGCGGSGGGGGGGGGGGRSGGPLFTQVTETAAIDGDPFRIPAVPADTFTIRAAGVHLVLAVDRCLIRLVFAFTQVAVPGAVGFGPVGVIGLSAESSSKGRAVGVRVLTVGGRSRCCGYCSGRGGRGGGSSGRRCG